MEENMLVEGMTNDILSFIYAAFLKRTPRYFMAQVTNLNFYILFRIESLEKANTCSRQRTPPWISFVDLEDVPEPKSFFSITRVRNPLVEASKQTPAPLAPPPITTISQLGLFSISATCYFRDLKPLNSFKPYEVLSSCVN